MALNDAPYYTSSSKPIDELGTQDLHDSHASIYPELGSTAVPDAQMYALADDALQAHQENTASHFAGLLQAATAAAGRNGEPHSDRIISSEGRIRRTTRRAQHLPHDQQDSSAETEEQRLAHTKYQENGSQSHNTRKRKRTSVVPMATEDGESVSLDMQMSTPRFQAPVSHSASTLFRRPSSTSAKYTRPPMSKLFTSLELSPDNFLQLQSAAKNYMLDDQYPDRKETVGQRGRGDSELVKLRLWNCVKDFLEGERNGERFFGPHVPGDEGGSRTMFWPSHKNNIITAVTPLLRRMVTNERQRQYAVETRNPESASETKDSKKRKLAREAVDSPLQQSHSFRHSAPRSGYAEAELHHFFHEINNAHLAKYEAWRPIGDTTVSPSIESLRLKFGVSPEDFCGLIATIDYHLRVSHDVGHHGDGVCSPECETAVVSHMLQTDFLENLVRDTHDGVTANGKNTMMTLMLEQLFANIKSLHSRDLNTNSRITEMLQEDEINLGSTHPTTQGLPSCQSNVNNGDAHPKSLMIHLSITKDDKRLFPRLDLPVDECLNLAALLDKALKHAEGSMAEQPALMVWLPEGLKQINGDAEWKTAIDLAASTDWMDGTIKVLWNTGTV